MTLLDKIEVSELLKVDVRTVENWMAERVVPFYKLKGTVRFDREEILEVMRKDAE